VALSTFKQTNKQPINAILYARGTHLCLMEVALYSPFTRHFLVSHGSSVAFSINETLMCIPLNERNNLHARGAYLCLVEAAWHSLTQGARVCPIVGALHFPTRGTHLSPIEGAWHSPYMRHSFVSHGISVAFSIQETLIF